jgi:peptidylprolyl isomerase
MSTVKEGTTVKVHYKGTLEDGTEFDNSRERGSTLEFEVGSGQLIRGFDTAVTGMGTGEVRIVTISSADAYGEVRSDSFQEYPRSVFGEDIDLEVGGVVQGTGPKGEPLMAKVSKLTEALVTLDHNHPLAGKDLTFEIELIEIVE